MIKITGIIEAQGEMEEALEKLAAVRDYLSGQVRAAQESDDDPISAREGALRLQLGVWYARLDAAIHMVDPRYDEKPSGRPSLRLVEEDE